MSEQTIMWLFGIGITLQMTVIGALVTAIWSHQNDCRDFRSSLSASVAEIKAQLVRIDRDIGTHETGIRGQLHQLTSDLTPLSIWAQTEQRFSEAREKARREREEWRSDEGGVDTR